jgi:hypothetical protein
MIQLCTRGVGKVRISLIGRCSVYTGYVNMRGDLVCGGVKSTYGMM